MDIIPRISCPGRIRDADDNASVAAVAVVAAAAAAADDDDNDDDDDDDDDIDYADGWNIFISYLHCYTVKPLYKGHPIWWPFKRGGLPWGVK